MQLEKKRLPFLKAEPYGYIAKITLNLGIDLASVCCEEAAIRNVKSVLCPRARLTFAAAA